MYLQIKQSIVQPRGQDDVLAFAVDDDDHWASTGSTRPVNIEISCEYHTLHACNDGSYDYKAGSHDFNIGSHDCNTVAVMLGHMPTMLGHMPTMLGHSTAVLDHMPTLSTMLGHSTAVMDHMTTMLGNMTTMLGHMTTVLGHMTTMIGHMTTMLSHMASELEHTTPYLASFHLVGQQDNGGRVLLPDHPPEVIHRLLQGALRSDILLGIVVAL